ncbi:MAG: hypothetical protein AB8I08_08030 [Sandaracinaceae bacterium]
MRVSSAYRAYVKANKRRLKALPYFAESHEKRRAFLVMFDELDRRADETSALHAILRAEPNACSDPVYRVLVTDYLRHQLVGDTSTEWEQTELTENTVVKGDLHVRGSLINAAALTVLGDLRVDGAYVTRGDYPCLQVAGSFSARHVYGFEAETAVLDELRVSGIVFVAYNHTVTVARVVRADTVCSLDAEISAEVQANVRHEDEVPMLSLFGVEKEDEVHRVAEWMLNDAHG